MPAGNASVMSSCGYSLSAPRRSAASLWRRAARADANKGAHGGQANLITATPEYFSAHLGLNMRTQRRSSHLAGGYLLSVTARRSTRALLSAAGNTSIALRGRRAQRPADWSFRTTAHCTAARAHNSAAWVRDRAAT